MENQEPIICPNCGSAYPPHTSECPECGTTIAVSTENSPPENTSEEIPEAVEEAIEDSFIKRPWWRRPVGCISIIIFFLLIIGGIILGAYDGLKEHTIRRQTEVDQHYQQALLHIENDQLDLAIAELNATLTLDPAHSEAREVLRQIKSTETPVTLLETNAEPRRNQAEELLVEAKGLTLQGNWEQAIDLLTQIRDIDPSYQPTVISESLYEANYEFGLRLITDGDLNNALHAFDKALEERPNDPAVTSEWEKVSLYLSLENIDTGMYEDRLVVLNRLYAIEPGFADVKQQLNTTYRNFGDLLAEQNEWCLAQPRYQSAAELFPGEEIETLTDNANLKCKAQKQIEIAAVTPTPRADTAANATESATTATLTATTAISGDLSGTLYFARFNAGSNFWEIRSVSLPDKQETVIIPYGTQPAISPNGGTLIYHSQELDSIGLHAFNTATGEDLRITTFGEDVLPQWGTNNQEFVFASQRSGDRRWMIMLGFADGKGDAVTIRDGRTPTLSPTADLVAYQGTDPQGNNPGIYIAPKGGGEATRLTTHESDRSPAVSATGQIAYMTSQNGNWDIWTVDQTGSNAAPLVESPGNDGLPVWSPDGSHLAFVSDRGGSWHIYVISAQGGTPQKITQWTTSHPDWLMGKINWGRN